MYNFIMFMFIFAVPFKGVPLNSSKLVILYLLLCYLISFAYRNKIEIPRLLLIPSCFYIFAIILSSIRIIPTGTGYEVPYMFAVGLFENYIGAYLLYSFFHDSHLRSHKATRLRLISSFVIAVTIQAFIIWGSILFEAFREMILSLLDNEEIARDLMRRYAGMRGHGLSAGLTFDLSVVFALAAYLNIMYLKRNLLYSISLIMCISCILITGRTGLIVLMTLMSIYLVHFASLKSTLKMFIPLSVFLTMIYILLYTILESNFEIIMHFAFEPLINYFQGDGIVSDSTNTLLSMYSEIKYYSENTLLFGDSYWIDPTSGRYYGEVDIGYYRFILFGGIAFSGIIYGFYLLMNFITLRILGRDNFSDVYLVILPILILSFFIELKGSFVFGTASVSKIYWLLIISLIFLDACNKRNNGLTRSKNKSVSERIYAKKFSIKRS